MQENTQKGILWAIYQVDTVMCAESIELQDVITSFFRSSSPPLLKELLHCNEIHKLINPLAPLHETHACKYICVYASIVCMKYICMYYLGMYSKVIKVAGNLQVYCPDHQLSIAVQHSSCNILINRDHLGGRGANGPLVPVVVEVRILQRQES